MCGAVQAKERPQQASVVAKGQLELPAATQDLRARKLEPGIRECTATVDELAKTTKKNGRAASENPDLRRRLMRVETRIEAMRLNGMRFLTKQLKGEKLGSETSINKLHRATLEIEMGEIAMEICGNAGSIASGAGTPGGGRWQNFALSWPEVVIGGGTPNIQRNIIAERILGLPKD